MTIDEPEHAGLRDQLLANALGPAKPLRPRAPGRVVRVREPLGPWIAALRGDVDPQPVLVERPAHVRAIEKWRAHDLRALDHHGPRGHAVPDLGEECLRGLGCGELHDDRGRRALREHGDRARRVDAELREARFGQRIHAEHALERLARVARARADQHAERVERLGGAALGLADGVGGDQVGRPIWHVGQRRVLGDIGGGMGCRDARGRATTGANYRDQCARRESHAPPL